MANYGENHEKVGTPVVFVDPQGRSIPAVLTAVWCSDAPYTYPNCSVNLVFVSVDVTKTDTYGRQIERATSVPQKSGQSANGYYWLEKV